MNLQLLMKWDRVWFNQKGRWIRVDEAIRLRESGTLKTGDLFCCECENTRVSPVDSVKRVRHFRQHPKFRREAERNPCNKIRRSNEKGESWKHSRVIDAIVHYLETDAKQDLRVESIELGETKLDPDITVTHASQIDGFEGETSYIIVPMMNLRRSRELFQSLAPNSVAVEMHRWRAEDVDFIEYIRGRVDKGYSDRTGGSYSPDFLHSKTTIPNMGVYEGKTGGFGRGMVLKIDSEMDEEADAFRVLAEVNALIDRVEEHNLWAVSVPGMHRFHLKNLVFEEFVGDGLHPEPCIDAILSKFSRIKDAGEVGSGNQEKAPDDWYIKACKGDDGALEDGFDVMDELASRLFTPESMRNALVESGNDPESVDGFLNRLEHGGFDEDYPDRVAQGHIDDGGDPDLAEEWGRAFSEFDIEGMQRIMREELRRQIDFEREWRKQREASKKLLMEAIDDYSTKKLTDMARKDKLKTIEEKTVIETDLGNVPLDSGVALNPFLLFEVPEAHFWEEIDEEARSDLIPRIKRAYRKSSFFRGAPIDVEPLTRFELGSRPLFLSDKNRIGEAIRSGSLTSGDTSLSPLSHDELVKLKYFLWADRDFSFPDPKHHSFVELVHKVGRSTDGITRRVSLDLPQPIEDMLGGSGDVNDLILDLLASSMGKDSEE